MRLAHQATFRFAGRLTTRVIFMARAMILSRLMAKDQYGLYGQAMMITALVSPYIIMGLQSAVPFLYARLTEERQKGLATLLTLYLTGAGMVVGLGLFFGAEAVAGWFDEPALASPLRLLSIAVLFMQLPKIVPAALLVKKRPILSALYEPAAELPIAIACVGAFIHYQTIEAMVIAIGIGRALEFAVGVHFFTRLPFPRIRPSIDRQMVFDTFRYAVPLGAAAIVGTTNATIDRLLIGWMFTAADFAVYRNGAFEIPVFALFAASIFPVLLPEMARLVQDGRRERMLELWKEGVRRCSMVVLPLVVFSFVFAHDIVVVLWSAKYVDSVPVFRLYTASLIIRIAQYQMVFVALGRPGIVLRISLAMLVLNAVAGFTLVQTVGFLGPAIAALATRYAAAGLHVMVIARVSEIPISKVLPWGALGRLLVVSSVSAGACYPLLWLDIWEPARLALCLGGSSILFVLLAWATGTIRASDAEFLTGPVLRRLRRRR